MSRKSQPVILVSPFRSGSRSLEAILASYLRTNRGIQYVDQPFDVWAYDLLPDDSWAVRSQRRRFQSQEELEKTSGERLSFVKKYYGNIFFKVHPITILRQSQHHLVTDYRWVVSDRKDLFAQFISFAVAYQSGRWTQGPGQTPLSPLKVEKKIFDTFCSDQYEFRRLLRLKGEYARIEFEDICKQDFSALGNLFPDLTEFVSTASTKAVLGVPNKWDLVTNLEECRLWYQSSPLNALYRIE